MANEPLVQAPPLPTYRELLGKQKDIIHKIKQTEYAAAYEKAYTLFELGVKLNHLHTGETVADYARKLGEDQASLYRLKAFVRSIDYSPDKFRDIFNEYGGTKRDIHSIIQAYNGYGIYRKKEQKASMDLTTAITYLTKEMRKAVDDNHEDMQKHISQFCQKLLSFNPYTNPPVDEGYFKYADCACCGNEVGADDHILEVDEDMLMYPVCEECKKDHKEPNYNYIAKLYKIYASNIELAYNRLLEAQ